GAGGRVIGKGAGHMSSPFPRCLSKMGSSGSQRSRYGLLGPILETNLRATAGHLLPDCCPHLVGGDRGYNWYVDTSRLVPSCLEHSGRLGPLACQAEIFVTLSGIYRYLGRLSTVLGMILIKLLQRRQVPGVVVFILVLHCCYHCP